MAKKRKNILVTDRDRWISNWSKNLKEGNYVPYFLTQDIASSGARYRTPGFKSERCHHFLSTNEHLFFFHLDYELLVSEIQEQYALLPLSLTQTIANQLGIKHPAYNSSIAAPLTTDFLVHMSDNTKMAYSIKQEGALEDSRTIEKQFIEKAYWELMGVEWRLIQSNEIKTTKSITLETLHFYRTQTELHQVIQPRWLDHFFSVLEQYPQCALRDVINEAANRCGVQYRFATELFKNAAWNRLLSFNFDVPLHFELPASDFMVVRNG